MGIMPQLRKEAAAAAIVAALAASAWADPPAGYYDSTNGLAGEALKDALHDLIDGHTVFPYDSGGTDVYDILEDLDESTTDSTLVSLTYKGTSVEKTSRPDGWNREHGWPQSMGADISPMVSDLHHIRAEDPSLNSSRNNSAFNEVASPTNSGYGNQWNGSEFEPRETVKGDVARGILYMDVRYDGTGPGNEAGNDLALVDSITIGYGQMGKKSVLIDWANNDAPDAQEMLRNDKIYLNYQANRNPFIDRPEFVDLIYGPVHNGDAAQASSTDRLTSPVEAGALAVPVLSVDISATTNEWELGAITLSRSGTLDGSAFSQLRLYRDMDGDGVIESGDPLFATGTFDESETSLTLTLDRPTRFTASGGSMLLTANISGGATDGGTFQLAVTGLVSSSTGGADPSYSGLNLASSTALVENNLWTPGVKIVEVSTRASSGASLSGTAATAEYIVLANQTASAVSLTGWQLRKLAGTNVLNLSGTIPAYGHFLIASQSYASASDVEDSPADQFVATTGLLGGLADGTASSIALFDAGANNTPGDSDDVKQDGFSWGGTASGDNTAPYYRDDPPMSTTLAANGTQVAARKRANGGSTGVYQDTDDNSEDLQVITFGVGVEKQPKNSAVFVPVAVSGFSVE